MLHRRALGLSALLALAAGCDDTQDIKRLSARGAFEPEALDFGEITVGTQKILPITLKSVGEIPLEIERIEVPQSFVLTSAKDRLVGVKIPTSGSIEAEVTFNAIAEGEASGTIIVHADNRTTELPVHGVGVLRREPLLAVDPMKLSFGTVEVGTEARASFLIRNTGLAAGTVDRASLRSTGADVRATDEYRLDGALPVTIEPEAELMLTVIFKPALAGPRNDQLLLGTGGSAAPLTLDLEGEGKVALGDLFCQPTPIDFGSVERGQSASRNLTCGARGGPVRLVAAELPRGMTDFVLPMPPSTIDLSDGQTASFPIEFHAQGLPMVLRNQLTVRYAGLNGSATIQIPLRGEVIPPPVTATALSLSLRWDTNLTDVDLHLVRPRGQTFTPDDCFFDNPAPDWGVRGDPSDDPFLDKDDTNGRGPETINLSTSAAATYDVYVHYFADNRIGPSRATVEVHVAGQSVGSYNHLLRCNDMWRVGSFAWNGTAGTFTPNTVVQSATQGDCN